MNDLLGGKEAGESEASVHLPKAEAGRPGRAPANFQPDVSEAAVSVPDELTMPTLLPRPANAMYAMCERAR